MPEVKVDVLPPLTADGEPIKPVLGGVDIDLDAPDLDSDVAEWDPTVRNRHLRRLSTELTRLEFTLKESSRSSNKKDTLKQENRTDRALIKACGRCGLHSSCEIADDLSKWHRLHPGSKTTDASYGTESRDTLLTRLKADPYSSCVPPAIA